MSDFNPNTETVRACYVEGRWARYKDADEDTSPEFDVWFAEEIRKAKETAWDEGAEYAWQSTGEGWNGEYAHGYGTHDGAVAFREAVDGQGNPYRKEDA